MLNYILHNLDRYPLDGVVHFELEIDYPFIHNVIDYMETECKRAGIKVKDVADTLGVSTQAVAKWQAGTALPTIDNLVILAAMLDTKIDDILVIA